MRILSQYFLLLLGAILFLAISVTSLAAPIAHESRHPIHITVTSLDLNTKTHSFELAIKIFADDFETAVKKTSGVQLLLGTSKEPKDAAQHIMAYLQNHIRLEANGKRLDKWVFVGKEMEGEATWVYIEIPNVQNYQKLTLTNTLLFDVYDDQTNLMNVNSAGQKKSALFRKGKETETLEF